MGECGPKTRCSHMPGKQPDQVTPHCIWISCYQYSAYQRSLHKATNAKMMTFYQHQRALRQSPGNKERLLNKKRSLEKSLHHLRSRLENLRSRHNKSKAEVTPAGDNDVALIA